MTCVFLILMGIFSKIAAVFLATPDAVIGGNNIYLVFDKKVLPLHL